jgi:hypothetical protein
MTRAALAFLALAAVVGAVPVDSIVFGVPPPTGAVFGLVNELIWAPQPVRDVYADAGYVFASQGNYVLYQSRAWYDASTNTLGLRRLPEGAELLRVKRASATCTDPVLCQAGGAVTDPLAEQVLDCACSSGSACRVPNPDGGATLPAPTGVTLDAFGGAGCVRKTCTELWVDGGDSWPVGCPQ